MAPVIDLSGQQLSSAQRILERAIDVIETSGEAAIRTNPIAFECGVTPPILYRAFGSREGLIIAAQAERYRRSSEEAAEYLFEYVRQATSRESLKENVAKTLDFIFSDARTNSRRLRVEVIGSSMSRPELRQHVRAIDEDYSKRIAEAYDSAVSKGWISPDRDLVSIVRWAQGIINARIMVDDIDDPRVAAEWDRLSKEAILRAVFD